MNVKQYLMLNESEPKKVWGPSVLHATPFPSREIAQATIEAYGIADATGTEQVNVSWYVVKEPKG